MVSHQSDDDENETETFRYNIKTAKDGGGNSKSG